MQQLRDVLFVIAMRMLFPRDGGVMGEDELGGNPLSFL